MTNETEKTYTLSSEDIELALSYANFKALQLMAENTEGQVPVSAMGILGRNALSLMASLREEGGAARFNRVWSIVQEVCKQSNERRKLLNPTPEPPDFNKIMSQLLRGEFRPSESAEEDEVN